MVGAPQFGPTAPATVAGPMPGQGSRGEVLISMAMSLIELALPTLADHEDKIAATQAHLTLIKRFGEVEQDMMEAEMKYMMSQLAPAPRPSPMDAGPGIRSSLNGLGVSPPQATEVTAPPAA